MTERDGQGQRACHRERVTVRPAHAVEMSHRGANPGP